MPTKPRSKVISYIRVSTKRQGKSGLGLEAQRAAVDTYCRAHDLELFEEFQEVESGKNCERPVLDKAIDRAKAMRATLLIAKIDRLGRDAYFILGLRKERGVDFRACDYPDDDPFMLGIRALIAEEEGRKISQRIKDALRAAKRRGVKLGASNPRCRNLTRQAARKGARSNALLAEKANAETSAVVTGLRSEGMTLGQIAAELDARGIFTRTGKAWNPMQVSRLVERAR